MKRKRKSNTYYGFILGILILGLIFGMILRKTKEEIISEDRISNMSQVEEVGNSEGGEPNKDKELVKVEESRAEVRVEKKTEIELDENLGYDQYLSDTIKAQLVKDVTFVGSEALSSIVQLSIPHNGMISTTMRNEQIIFHDLTSQDAHVIFDGDNINSLGEEGEIFKCLLENQQIQKNIHWVKGGEKVIITTDNYCQSDQDIDFSLREAFLVYDISSNSTQYIFNIKELDIYDLFGQIRYDLGNTERIIATENGASLVYEGISYKDKNGASKYIPALKYAKVNNPKVVGFREIQVSGEVIKVDIDNAEYVLDVSGEYIWRSKDHHEKMYVIEISKILTKR